jgi:hypothetical protein
MEIKIKIKSKKIKNSERPPDGAGFVASVRATAF